MCNSLQKINHENDDFAEVADLLEYFDIETEEAKMIEASHKEGHGIEG